MAVLWEALGIRRPGVTACVGAGGKTSMLLSLAAGADERGLPNLVTTTTHMFYCQVAKYDPVLIGDYDEGLLRIGKILEAGRPAAWFSERIGDKVRGLPPDWTGRLAEEFPGAFIFVEADGARQCLLKAPAGHEPVIPDCTAMTIGILNLCALGQPLTDANTHRLNLVTSILDKQVGETIIWTDVARLLTHRNGIFQYARGAKVAVLTGGGNNAAVEAARQIAGYIKAVDRSIDRVVVTAGFGTAMRPVEVFR